MLRFRHRMRPRQMQIRPAGGPEARLLRLRQIVSGLIRYERIEPTWTQADEARQYAERLIHLAVRNGDQHKPTMELADYWLLEKDLVHKLFKVLVPRYRNQTSSFTDLHKQAVEYPGHGNPNGVLELRGNPWPPVAPRRRDTKFLLSNVLLAAARKDFYESKRQQKQQDLASSSSPSSSTTPLSSSSEEFSETTESNTVEEEGHSVSSSVDPPSSKPTTNER
ncbi:39S ribosomal protein L17, mitochondrial [Aplysia californica]|uniref:Large ribosomal subunit protein bL17m n=1 Tax=Aplysia californica TaxID=6500 RepID=A0ABM0JNE3_APLCA|nr:39S ribosomal protein L17, mitochondrial [Aplysia californica]